MSNPVSSRDFSVTLLSWDLCFLAVIVSFSSAYSLIFLPYSGVGRLKWSSTIHTSLGWFPPTLNWDWPPVNWIQRKWWCVTSEARSRQPSEALASLSWITRLLCEKSAATSNRISCQWWWRWCSQGQLWGSSKDTSKRIFHFNFARSSCP